MKSEVTDKIDELCRVLEPVKPVTGSGLFWRWLGFSSIFMIGATSFVGLRPDLILMMQSGQFWFEAIANLAVMMIAMFGAYYISIPGHRLKTVKKLFLTALAIWIGQMLIKYFFFMPQAVRDDFRIFGSVCAVYLAAVSIVPLGLFIYFIRKSAPTLLGWTGIIGFIGVASAGSLSLQFHCHVNDFGHLFFFHVIPVLAIGVIGILVGKKLFRVV